MKTITFELENPLEYSSPGSGLVEGNHIDLNEPTGKVSHLCCEIEGMLQSAAMKMADMFSDADLEKARTEADKTPEKESEPDGDAALAIMMGSGVDMKKMVLLFRELFKEVAMVGGEKNLTVPLMDRMNHREFRKMMGSYTANFIQS